MRAKGGVNRRRAYKLSLSFADSDALLAALNVALHPGERLGLFSEYERKWVELMRYLTTRHARAEEIRLGMRHDSTVYQIPE